MLDQNSTNIAFINELKSLDVSERQISLFISVIGLENQQDICQICEEGEAEDLEEDIHFSDKQKRYLRESFGVEV